MLLLALPAVSIFYLKNYLYKRLELRTFYLFFYLNWITKGCDLFPPRKDAQIRQLGKEEMGLSPTILHFLWFIPLEELKQPKSIFFLDIPFSLYLSLHFLLSSLIYFHCAHQPNSLFLSSPQLQSVHPGGRAPLLKTSSYHLLVTAALVTISRVTTAIMHTKYPQTWRENRN